MSLDALSDNAFYRYGLGMIYFRQEKYKLAEIHFRRALSINGGSTGKFQPSIRTYNNLSF